MGWGGVGVGREEENPPGEDTESLVGPDDAIRPKGHHSGQG